MNEEWNRIVVIRPRIYTLKTIKHLTDFYKANAKQTAGLQTLRSAEGGRNGVPLPKGGGHVGHMFQQIGPIAGNPQPLLEQPPGVGRNGVALSSEKLARQAAIEKLKKKRRRPDTEYCDPNFRKGDHGRGGALNNPSLIHLSASRKMAL